MSVSRPLDKPLDFRATASVCGDMEQHDSDLGHQFAQLTGVFEDAAGLAAEGQGADVPTSERRALLKTLNKLNRKAQSILDTLRTQLGITQ